MRSSLVSLEGAAILCLLACATHSSQLSAARIAAPALPWSTPSRLNLTAVYHHVKTNLLGQGPTCPQNRYACPL